MPYPIASVRGTVLQPTSGEPPTGVYLRTPSGIQTVWTSDFTWRGLPDATYYLISIQDRTGQTYWDAWLDLAMVGGDNMNCHYHVAAAEAWNNLDLQWQIQDYGNYGYGSWTPVRLFSISVP